VNSLTREQRVYGAAGASVLFIISLFFKWFGFSAAGFSSSANGTEVVPSWWILLIFAAGAAAILLAQSVNVELPSVIHPAAWPAYLTSVCFIVTLMIFLEGDGRKFGIFLALIFSLAAAVLSTMHWKEESR
jgi:ribose/xylose/arabinose/galactoside ABC-type transport system permease subunit